MFSLVLSSAYTRSDPFCFLLHQWVGLGVDKALGGVTVRTAVNNTPTEQRDIPHHIWHHAQPIKLGGEGGNGRMFRVMAFTFSSNFYLWWSPPFWEILLMGSGEWITYFARLVCTAFAVTIKLPLTSSMSFLTFTLLILSPISPVGSVWVSGADSPAGVRPWEQVSWGMDWHKHLHRSLTCRAIVQTVVLLITAAVENPLQIHRISPVYTIPLLEWNSCW